VRDLAATVRPLLALWKDERLPGEHFGDYCSRVGFEHLKAQVEVLV
jgi:sulfite reductase (ferredoxin)